MHLIGLYSSVGLLLLNNPHINISEVGRNQKNNNDALPNMDEHNQSRTLRR